MKVNVLIVKIFFVLSLFFPVKGQTLNLEGEIYEYATYYVSSFDIATGATNVQIFRYELSSTSYPVPIQVQFYASLVSPQLGINSPTTIVKIITDPFDLKAPVILDNRDISSETSEIFDLASPPNQITITGRMEESLDPTKADAILQSILSSGKISDGQYTFSVKVISAENGNELVSDEKTIVVQAPVSISLESPGGILADTLDNIIYSTFPIFQWFAQSGTGFNTFIRVAEFNKQLHSSPEDAIEDQRVLPFDQNEYWYSIDNVNSFQYPFSGAYPLEEGNVYVWQVKKTMPTTAGEQELLSSIFSFKIGVSGQMSDINPVNNSLLLSLKQAIGDDQFNALFGQGNELQGFVPSGQLEINGVTVDESSVNYLLNQITNQNVVIKSLAIE